MIFSLNLAAVGAIPFLDSFKKEPVESLPPVAEPSPILNPNQPKMVPKQVPASDGLQPESFGPVPIVQPEDPVQSLVEVGVYPENWGERTTALNRAELADVLVKALKHNTKLVSEFPFYRDVDQNHWAYIPIEVARNKKLLTFDEHGFYHPEQTVTFTEVFNGIAHAITGPMLSEDEMAYYLVIYPDWEDIPADVRPAVAKMTRSRFFEERLSPALQLAEEATPKAIAPYIVSLTHLNERRTILPPKKEALLPTVPEGLTITASPTVAIFESGLTIGQNLYFSLVDPIASLPKGSKLRGTVKDSINPHAYVVELTEAETPEEQVYRIRAELNIEFHNKAMPFIVPGETFQAVTLAPDEGSATKKIPPFSPANAKPAPKHAP